MLSLFATFPQGNAKQLSIQGDLHKYGFDEDLW